MMLTPGQTLLAILAVWLVLGIATALLFNNPRSRK